MERKSQTLETLFKDWAENNGYPAFSDEEYLDLLGRIPRLREAGKEVLDLGCGIGHVSSFLKRLGHRVTGVDLSPEAIEKAIRQGRIDSGLVAKVEATGLPAGQFDVIICFCVTLYLRDLKPALGEMARLLKPGGEILILDHHRRNPYAWLHFSRPDWVDRWLEGKSNVWRRPMDEKLIRDHSPVDIRWKDPEFLSLFTRHPNRIINVTHDVARSVFAGIRKVSQAPWTGNLIIMSGRKISPTG